MNKLLLLNSRPVTVFDVTNKDHRKSYYNFLKYSTWGRSSYQFILEPGFEDVPTMCRYQLCEYYVGREFDTVAKNTTSSIGDKLTVVKLKSKTKSTVD